MQGKHVLEIGCGKGEFLTLMLEAGAGRGTGIDPSLVPERLSPDARERATWIRDAFGEDYLHLSADAIVCRHTLEHIAPVAGFLSQVRRSIGDRAGVPVLFELPDVGRVLQEGAFWDIYYEHCSYFSAGSLARLFRREGFEVRDLALEYDGQYLVLDAQPSEGGAGAGPLPGEESVAALRESVNAFVMGYDATIARWDRVVADHASDGKRVVLWGGGSKAVAFLTALHDGSHIKYVVDINPHKQGRFIAGTGQEVVAPEVLTGYRPDLVIAMNPVYADEIRASLDDLGVEAPLVSV